MYQHVGIFWRYLTLKFPLSPTQTPDASQWNIGDVGPSGVGAGVGHVHFRLLCQFHLRLVANANAVFSGIWARLVHVNLL